MTSYFQFAHPAWLYALIPALCLLLLRKRRGAEGVIAHPTLHMIAPLLKQPQSLAGRIGSLLMVLGTVFLVTALARPQIVDKQTFKQVSGIDIMIAFDLSGSMDTADMIIDGRVQTTRLIAAKDVIDAFVAHRPNDRIGVVGFAAKSKVFVPLTLDHQLVRRTVGNFNLELIKHDGTAIGAAIAAAASRLEPRKETKSKIIILVTDGASNFGIAPVPAAEQAAAIGIKIYTVAIGTEEGTIGPRTGVSSNFDEPTLQEIARVSGGEHYRARTTDSLYSAFSSIDHLEKSEAKSYTTTNINELFMWCLAASACLITVGLALQSFRPAPAP